MRALVNCCLFALLLSTPVALCGGMLIEAELFSSCGGWTLDQQFFDSVGSSVLLAHGCGRPVDDAHTEVSLPGAHFTLYVRTRDWCAPHGPGAFAVMLHGMDGLKFFESQAIGVGNGEWGWVDAGEFDFEGGRCEVVLHDLTGFDGRVDALYFASAGESPPKGWEDRKRLLGLTAAPATNVYDLVVVGGGIAGMCAAVSAAREGLHVGIVQDRGCWGGNASREIRIKPAGDICDFPYRSVWEIVREVNQLFVDSDDEEKAWMETGRALDSWMAGIGGIDGFLLTRAIGVNMATNGAIKSIEARNVVTGSEMVLAADLFVDATGDACVANMAGAECLSRIESWAETAEVLAPAMWEETGGYGSTIPWASRTGKQVSAFPQCTWAVQIDNWEDFLVFGEKKGKLPTGCWNWEACIFDDPVSDGERVRDHLFRAIYGTWDFIKNKCPEREKFERAELAYVGVVLGKRAAKRVVGDYILTGTDILDGRSFEDGVVGIGWHLDMHVPARSQRARLGENCFRSESMPDDIVQRQRRRRLRNKPPEKRAVIPYRCLYSRDVPNLFVAGKILSATHVAMGACRVMNTCGAMGVVVGKAATFCRRLKCRPRDISCGKDLREFLAFLEHSR